jgi:hypothetical protein
MTVNEAGVWIFCQPHPEWHYVWFGDPAEGLEHGDDSAICWLCCETGQQAAEYLGKLSGLELGELAYDMGEYYGWAYGCFENNKDQSSNNKLVELNYPALHYEQRLGKRSGPVDTLKPGWNTNTLTRNWMVRHALSWTRDGSIHPISRRLLDQMEIFSQNPRGKYEAIPGGHDDAVMAFLGACQMWKVWMDRQGKDDLAPLVAGQEVEPAEMLLELPSEDTRTREERLSERALERMERAQRHSDMEGLVW